MSDRDYLLVFNAGSSSLKFEIFSCSPRLRSRARGGVHDIGRPRSRFRLQGEADEETDSIAGAAEAAALVLERARRGLGEVRLTAGNLVATGHRVVHGGERFSAPVRVTDATFDALEGLVHLAPLHNAQSLAVMAAVEHAFHDVPMVAVFDTAFFSELPEPARAYAIPSEWSERQAIRRYGFHGISHQHLSEQLETVVRSPASLARVVSLHLGQGCSVAALRDRRPVETSMGFTPLEGLVMATRSGDVDAGVLLHMARQGHSWEALEDALNRRSGLLGLSGVSDDVRELLALESRRHGGARLALAAFCHRIHKYLGAYAAVLGGIDAIVIGGGIGENSPEIRARILAGLSWLGFALDAEANEDCVGQAGRISTDDSTIEVHVVPVDEEPIIAKATLAVLSGTT